MAVLVVAAGALNAALYQGSRERLLRERWEQLTEFADARRTDLRSAIEDLRRKALLVTDHAPLESWARGTARGRNAQALVGAQLDRAVRILGFRAVHLATPDGSSLSVPSRTPVGGSPTVEEPDLARARAFAVEAGATGEHSVSVVPRLADAGPALMLAVPVGATPPAKPVATAIFVAGIEEMLEPLLTRVPPFTGSVNAYLVARSDGRAVRLNRSETPGTVEALSPSASRAALGVESAADVPAVYGQEGWTVTRYLPEIGLGLVVEADRAAMLGGSRDTLWALLVLDLGMGLLAFFAIGFWRRRYEDGLQQRERAFAQEQLLRIQGVFDNVFDAVLTFDHRGRVQTANRAAQVLFQHSAQQIVGEPVHRFVRWRAGWEPGSIESLPLETVSSTEALRADGTEIPVEFTLTSAGEGDQRVCTAVVRDVSERLEAEEQIRTFAHGLEASNRQLEEANAQLEEASRVKSEFLANTSHELRTPLNGVIGFLQLVLDEMCDSPEEEREFLRQALQCSRHLLGLINDVLDIAKIEAGKLTLEIEAVDIQKLFGEVYSLTHVQAAQKGITLRFEPPERPSAVRGDFGKMKQVLINLIGNSLKFTPKGRITVRAREQADLGHCMFEVRDTGIGIPPERQKLIFEKFTQGDGSSTRKHGGTGLGLAISRSLVELMGGIIGVESEGPGRGTRMYFSLPTWRAPELEDEADAEIGDGTDIQDRIRGPHGGPLILIVEDDPVFRKFLTSLLHRQGNRTVEATTAEGGWVLARRLQPAVVVLDYALSCAEAASLRTGWDLAERMTSDPRTRHTPVVFLTGFELQLKEKLGKASFVHPPDYLMKPVDGATLLAKIHQLVGETHDRVVRILMADDDPSVAAYVRKVLPERRFHIEVANDGEECLHILRTQPEGFDLLLLDLMMPDVSGYDVLRELTLNRLIPKLPVLILTNFPEARNDEEKRLLERGIVLDVLSKSAVHENPVMLSHIIDWHLQVALELEGPGPVREKETTAEEVWKEAA